MVEFHGDLLEEVRELAVGQILQPASQLTFAVQPGEGSQQVFGVRPNARRKRGDPSILERQNPVGNVENPVVVCDEYDRAALLLGQVVQKADDLAALKKLVNGIPLEERDDDELGISAVPCAVAIRA